MVRHPLKNRICEYGGSLMPNKINSIQDIYLNSLRKEKVPVTVYLTTGIRLKGIIMSFDNFVIVLKQEKNQLIFKHAIVSIVPDRDVDLRSGESKEG